MGSRRIGAVLAITGLANAIAYNGPIATPVVKRFAADGWTPKPTSEPKPLLELFRRQDDPAFCGYLEGDADSAVTCGVGSSCMYAENYGWFGCCTGSSITDCNVITACVESKSIDDCLSVSECRYDSLAISCTDRAEPYCMGLYTVITGETYGHFECATTDTTLEVLPTALVSASSRSLFLGTETTEGFPTDEPTATRFRSSRSTSTDDDEKKTESETSTESRLFFSLSTESLSDAPRTTTEEGTRSASPTPANEVTSTVTAGAAMRTAEAVFGAAGGVVGLLALLA